MGYSLVDYNLRLLFHTLRWKIHPAERPATFSIDLHPDPLIFTGYGADANKPAQEPLVSFIVQDIWTFIPELYQEIKGLRMPA